MEMSITKYEYVKTEIENYKIQIPEEPLYYFEFGYRDSWAIIPVWTTWNVETNNKPEEIWMLKVIKVNSDLSSQKGISRFEIQLSQIESILNEKSNTVYTDKQRVVDNLIEGVKPRSVRTKEQFMADYNNVINDINELLES